MPLQNRTLAPWEAFTASFVTRAMVTTVTMPMSVVKTRFEVSSKQRYCVRRV